MNNSIERSISEQHNQDKIAPIVIFQPGKVGSSSMLASLNQYVKSKALDVPVYHAHNLEGLEKLEEDVKIRFPNPVRVLKKLEFDKDLRKKIDSGIIGSWNVITLTREPVARNISTLFEMLDVFIPDWQSRYESGQLDLLELQKLLIAKFPSRPGRGDWFDVQMKPVFGVDVYAYDFPREHGYYIYDTENKARLLLIRLEDLNRVGQTAMNQFLNVENFSFVEANVGEAKVYSDLYRDFKNLPLPQSYLEMSYSSLYARHFYSDQEIENFIQNWMKIKE